MYYRHTLTCTLGIAECRFNVLVALYAYVKFERVVSNKQGRTQSSEMGETRGVETKGNQRSIYESVTIFSVNKNNSTCFHIMAIPDTKD
jgi:hypothetical protein